MNAFVKTELAALVVESNSDARHMLVRTLKAANISRILEACDGTDAIAALRATQAPVDLVIMESGMRTPEGTAIVRALILRQKPPSFIFVRRAGRVTWSATEVDVRTRGLTVLGTVDTAATMAGVARLLKKLTSVSPVQLAPVAASFPSLPRAAAEDICAAAASAPDGTDVAAYLFKVGERCQRELLNKHGLTCVMDLDRATLAFWRCRILGGVVQAMLVGICNGAGTFNPEASIAVALHRFDDVWVLSVAEHGFQSIQRQDGAAEFGLARSYARPLNGEWHTRITSGGAITTLRFSIDPQPRYLTPSEMLSTDETNYFRKRDSVFRFNNSVK